MGNSVGKKKRIAAIAVIILISVFCRGILFYWKIPSRRESMTLGAFSNASEVSKIEMVVMRRRRMRGTGALGKRSLRMSSD